MNLITGATGIVGSRILYDLLVAGMPATCLKRAGSDMVQLEKVFSFYGGESAVALLQKVNWITGDLLDVESLEMAMTGASQVYHAAALVSYQKADAEQLMTVNHEGTANVVNMALDCGIDKICFISSVAALGRAKKNELTTEKNEWNSAQNTSVYGLSKFMAERELWRGSAEGLSTIIVNPSIILGAARSDQSSGALMSVLKNGPKGYPKGVGGYVDVRDVSASCIALMGGKFENEGYLLNAENLSYKKLMAIAAEVFHNDLPSLKLNPWMLKMAAYFSILKSKIDGSQPKVTLETAHSASRRNAFDNTKIKRALGRDFISVRESLEYYRAFYD